MALNLKSKNLLLMLCLTLASPVLYAAMDAGTLSPKLMRKFYPGKAYSPYAQRSFPSNVFWGTKTLTAWREVKRSYPLPGYRSNSRGHLTGW
jgi:hypothetical protein